MSRLPNPILAASGPVRRGLGWWDAWPDGHVPHRRPPPGGSV